MLYALITDQQPPAHIITMRITTCQYNARIRSLPVHLKVNRQTVTRAKLTVLRVSFTMFFQRRDKLISYFQRSSYATLVESLGKELRAIASNHQWFVVHSEFTSLPCDHLLAKATLSPEGAYIIASKLRLVCPDLASLYLQSNRSTTMPL